MQSVPPERILSKVFLIAVICLGGLLSGCGAWSPQSAYKNFRNAMLKKDFIAAWNCNSRDAQERFDEWVAALRRSDSEWGNISLNLLGVSRQELAGLDGREFFIRYMTQVASDKELWSTTWEDKFRDSAVKEIRADGEQATLIIERRDGSLARVKVRGGKWGWYVDFLDTLR